MRKKGFVSKEEWEDMSIEERFSELDKKVGELKKSLGFDKSMLGLVGGLSLDAEGIQKLEDIKSKIKQKEDLLRMSEMLRDRILNEKEDSKKEDSKKEDREFNYDKKATPNERVEAAIKKTINFLGSDKFIGLPEICIAKIMIDATIEDLETITPKDVDRCMKSMKNIVKEQLEIKTMVFEKENID